MTGIRRIALNVLASYGRSLIALILGLFSVRWVLAALGKEEYGLYAVVGSLIVFISFFNTLLGISIARYYAVSIGKGMKLSQKVAREDLQRWFNTALSLHTVVPVVLIVIGYPIAVFAIRHWVNIPVERIDACVQVFRIAIVTAFISMFSVPFISMYTARQWIAELSFFGMFSVVCNFISAYCLTWVDSDRLIAYAFFMMLVNAGIPLLQIILAVIRFPECRFRFSYWFDWARMRSLLTFAGWTTFGFGGYTCGFQGIVLVTNHYYGAAVNSAYGVANQLSAQTGAVANALMGALSPVIATREGAGDRGGMVSLAFQTGKIGAFLLLVFAIPLGLELPMIVQIWLKNPPEWVVPVCIVIMCGAVLDKLVMGHQMALNASGRIAAWQFCQGVVLACMVLFAVAFSKSGFGPLSASLGYVCSSFLSMMSMLYFGRRQLGMSILSWLKSVALPIVIVGVCGLGVGMVSVLLLPQSIFRIPVTAAGVETMLITLGWFSLLRKQDRDIVRKKIGGFVKWRRDYAG